MSESDLCLPLRQGVLKCIWANVKWSLGCTSWRLTQLAVVLLFLPLLPHYSGLNFFGTFWSVPSECFGFSSAPEILCFTLLYPLLNLSHLSWNTVHIAYCSAQCISCCTAYWAPRLQVLHIVLHWILPCSMHIMQQCILLCTASYNDQQRLLFLPHVLYTAHTHICMAHILIYTAHTYMLGAHSYMHGTQLYARRIHPICNLFPHTLHSVVISSGLDSEVLQIMLACNFFDCRVVV